MSKQILTQENLRSLFDYDPETGVFTRLKATGSRSKLGPVTRAPYKNGYIYLSVDGTRYLAHRLAWLWVYGAWPKHTVDHIDRNRLNNCIGNLRDVTHRTNTHNQTMRNTNTSGYTGVVWSKQTNKWIAQIKAGGRCHNLGHYPDIKQASAAYLAAKAVYHPTAPL